MKAKGNWQLSTVVFSLLILAGICSAFLATFGPVKLLGVSMAAVGVIAIRTEQRKRRQVNQRSGR